MVFLGTNKLKDGPYLGVYIQDMRLNAAGKELAGPRTDER